MNRCRLAVAQHRIYTSSPSCTLLRAASEQGCCFPGIHTAWVPDESGWELQWMLFKVFFLGRSKSTPNLTVSSSLLTCLRHSCCLQRQYKESHTHSCTMFTKCLLDEWLFLETRDGTLTPARKLPAFRALIV